jgi:hypothetical protein
MRRSRAASATGNGSTERAAVTSARRIPFRDAIKGFQIPEKSEGTAMSADGLSYIESSDVEYRTDFLEVAGRDIPRNERSE